MTTQLDIQNLDESVAPFAANLVGSVHLPASPRYDMLALPWNVAVPNRPVAVVEAGSAGDVAAAVRYAAEHGLQVSVQATGHGAVEYAKPMLQVNTSALQELTITASGAVRAGAGLRWKTSSTPRRPWALRRWPGRPRASASSAS